MSPHRAVSPWIEIRYINMSWPNDSVQAYLTCDFSLLCAHCTAELEDDQVTDCHSPGFNVYQNNHNASAVRSSFGGHKSTFTDHAAREAPEGWNRKSFSHPSNPAYSMSCLSFFPSFSSIMRYAIHRIDRSESLCVGLRE